MVINRLFSFYRVLIYCGTLSFGLAETVQYNDILQQDGWELHHADPLKTTVPLKLNHSSNALIASTNALGYGIYSFDSTITLYNPGDYLDFSYLINIAHTGGPYGYTVGIGILTFRGDTNVHAGLGGNGNGEFNATFDQDEVKNCYSFRSSPGENGLTLISPQFTLKDVVPSLKDTSISGHIAWNAEEELFVASFSVGNISTSTIPLASELHFEGIGVSLYAPNGSTATFSNLQITYHYASIPEASSILLILLSIPLITMRRIRPTW